MTPIEQWNAMTPRERDAWIAEIWMGWHTFSPIDPNVDYSIGVNGFRRNYAIDPTDNEYKPFPNYNSDISAAMRAEEKIMQMGEAMRSKYVLNLLYVVKVENRSPFSGDELFALIHASAADRCAAMFLTINAINGKVKE